MTKRRILILFSLTSMLLSACFCQEMAIESLKKLMDWSTSDSDERFEPGGDKELASAWQKDINQLNALYQSQVIPEHLKNEQPQFDGTEFDLMQIFTFLDHISMRDGFKLAYSYFCQPSFAGNPTLYVCEVGFAGTPDDSNCHRNFLDYVEVDGSELGYLQLILLRDMGAQFYVYWHAAQFNDNFFVATDEALNAILTEIDDSLGFLQKSRAALIDPTPRVKVEGDVVKLRVIWFTKFGGFFETHYQVNKDHPHYTEEIETNLILEYQCGFIY